jgi:hypothetical protein
MNFTTLKPVTLRGDQGNSPAPTLRSVVLKSALLNVVIVLTSFPVLVVAGGPRAVVPTLAVMAGISGLIWTATFALFSFASLARLFLLPVSTAKRPDRPRRVEGASVADRWLDGPN